jgi:hypothetical protein
LLFKFPNKCISCAPDEAVLHFPGFDKNYPNEKERKKVSSMTK